MCVGLIRRYEIAVYNVKSVGDKCNRPGHIYFSSRHSVKYLVASLALSTIVLVFVLLRDAILSENLFCYHIFDNITFSLLNPVIIWSKIFCL